MSYSSNKYEKTPAMDADPREIEAWALMKSARQLDNACRNLDNPNALRDSLRQNQVLWTIFQASVTAEDCALPEDLRENVLRLSVFVDGRTFTCLGNLDPDSVQALIDINRNVALGLQTNPNADQEEKAVQPQRTGTLHVTDA
ncbi:MAG: flagellar biosynthesis regulator FlaF [Magnetovibrio sp.]|nr:flagellar biosynthesis regulator FlaF [Magnetovibrio sp.]